jgi:hypothetical protein
MGESNAVLSQWLLQTRGMHRVPNLLLKLALPDVLLSCCDLEHFHRPILSLSG